MRFSRLSMMAACNDLATADEDRAHRRIGAGVTKALAGFAERCAHETLVCCDTRHIT
jgi:hypothetical protein